MHASSRRDSADFAPDSRGARRKVPRVEVQEYAGPMQDRDGSRTLGGLGAPGEQPELDALDALDELDRGVVHALQVHPRASWALVGEVLGVDPVTAARRWRRLEKAGLAWVTAYPRLSDARIVVTGVIEVDTEPGAAEDVAQALADDPAVPNVKLTAGGRDVVASVQTRTLDELSRLSGSLFRPIPGVRATRTHVSTGLPTEGSRWRLRSLDTVQTGRLEQEARPPTPTAPTGSTGSTGSTVPPRWDSLDARLLELLSVDGRMSLRDLSAASDAPSRRCAAG